MAIDPHTATRSAPDPALVSAVENEIPAYRAIPPLAIAGLLAGFASLLCFAWLGFLPLAVLAILCGGLALRKIHRQPDMYTGRGFAQLGIAFGLIFGLSSFTYTTATTWVLSSRAESFAKGQLLPIFQEAAVSDAAQNNASLNDALWYKAPPERRRSMTPEQVRQAMDNPNAPGTAFLEQQVGGLVSLMEHLKLWPGAETKYVKIERTGSDDAVPVAVALLEIKWPESAVHNHDEHEHDPNDPNATEEEKLEAKQASSMNRRGDFMAVVLKSRREGRSLAWWVDDYVYPYRPDTYASKAKKVDDGHGH